MNRESYPEDWFFFGFFLAVTISASIQLLIISGLI